MEHLTSIVSFDIFTDNYFTIPCLLTHLTVNNNVSSTKIVYAIAPSLGKDSSKKGERDHFELKQKSSVTLTVVD